jgi:hypothetical protein
MKDESQDSNFLSWARQVTEQKHAVLELMLKSDSTLDRVIARDILQSAGVEINA